VIPHILDLGTDGLKFCALFQNKGVRQDLGKILAIEDDKNARGTCMDGVFVIVFILEFPVTRRKLVKR
jgi:hypothetical protein